MKYTKDEIFLHIVDILQDQFDIDSTSVHKSARLREDLDIDSIDAVNLIIELKTLTGRKLPLESLQKVETVNDVIDAVHRFLEQDNHGA